MLLAFFCRRDQPVQIPPRLFEVFNAILLRGAAELLEHIATAKTGEFLGRELRLEIVDGFDAAKRVVIGGIDGIMRHGTQILSMSDPKLAIAARRPLRSRSGFRRHVRCPA